MRWLAALLLVTAAARAEETGPSFGSPLHYTESGGAAVYAGACAGCHQPQGQGAAGAGAYPALAGDPRLVAQSYVIARVLRGRGAMPPFARTLTDEQVAAVVDYVRTHFGNAFAGQTLAADVAAAR